MSEEDLKRLKEKVDAITPESVIQAMTGQITLRGDAYVEEERPHVKPLTTEELMKIRIQEEIIDNMRNIDWDNLPDKQTITCPLGEIKYIQIDIQLKDIPKGHTMR
jgi:hypothetical protein